MTQRMRDAYRRIVAFLKPQLSQGSTVRALMLSVTPAGVVGGVLSPDHLAIGMLIAGLLAALIPDELP
jgi:hypothetical protein